MAVPGHATCQQHLGRDKLRTRTFGDYGPCKSLPQPCPVCEGHSVSVIWHFDSRQGPWSQADLGLNLRPALTGYVAW